MDNRTREMAEWVLFESSASREIKEKAFQLLTEKFFSIGIYPLLQHEYEKIACCIREGKKINAIKELRIACSLTLKEAKDAIDPYFPSYNVDSDKCSPPTKTL